MLQGNENEPPTGPHNVDEFYKGNAEQKEPDMKGYVVCGSIYIKFKTRQN